MNKTKKVSLVLILTFCLLFVTACSSSSNTGNTTINQSSTENNTSEDTEIVETVPDISVEEQVLLDYNGIIITLKSLHKDSMFGPSLKILVENNSEKAITVQVRDVAINDVMVEAMFSCDVASGKKANDEIIFAQSDFEAAGITTIKDIEFKFHIFDSQNWEEIFDSEAITITTTVESSFVQTYDDSGLLVIDDNGFKIVMKRVDNSDSFWGADVHVYIENNTDLDATIQVRDVSINGFMINPVFSCDILAGKKAYDTITFFENDLVENDIKSIDSMELVFHIFDTKGWNTIYDSPTISVAFE